MENFISHLPKASFDVGMFGLIFVPLELLAVSSILSAVFQQKRGQKRPNNFIQVRFILQK